MFYLIRSLANEKAQGKEEGLELSSEEDKGGEATEGDEDRQQGETSHDPAEAIASFVPDVRQRDRHHRTCGAE